MMSRYVGGPASPPPAPLDADDDDAALDADDEAPLVDAEEEAAVLDEAVSAAVELCAEPPPALLADPLPSRGS
jgi:hypothetical protein